MSRAGAHRAVDLVIDTLLEETNATVSKPQVGTSSVLAFEAAGQPPITSGAFVAVVKIQWDRRGANIEIHREQTEERTLLG